MIALPMLGFIAIAGLNYLSAKFGYSSLRTGDKDILFPFSATLFLFYSLLIYLPQVHGKIQNLQKQSSSPSPSQSDEWQQPFPIAFLFSLLSLSLAVFMDRFCLNKPQSMIQDDEKNLRHENNYPSSHENNNETFTQQAPCLKYFLSLSVLLINIYSAYFVTVEHKESSLWAELLIFCIFGSVLNFSYGLLLAWAHVEEELSVKLFGFVNAGLLAGLILAVSLEASGMIIILPCIAIGFAIYTAVFICLPKIFTNGQKPVQDKFRFWAIFTALLLTLLYYPMIYLLKI